MPDKFVLVWKASAVVSPILVMFVFSCVIFSLFSCEAFNGESESVHHVI